MLPDEAQAQLGSRVSAAPFSDVDLQKPVQDPSFQMAKLLCPSYLWPSMTHTSEEIPNGRIKLIHTFGTVAKIKFDVTAPGRCTGIFQRGGIGLARLSLARYGVASFTPGMAVKVFVKDQPSLNFHVMNSLEGQGADRGWFSRYFSNVLPLPVSLPQKVLWQTFGMAVRTVSSLWYNRPVSQGLLPLYQAAAVTSDGVAVAKPVTPYQIEFEPTKEAVALYTPYADQDPRRALSHIPVGTAIYSIRLREAEGAELGPAIGHVVTASKFVASDYGDKHLFFQHMQHRQPPAAAAA